MVGRSWNDAQNRLHPLLTSPGRRHWLGRRSLTALRWKRRLKQRLGLLEPLRLDVYGGYAGQRGAIVWGRALEDEVPAGPTPKDTLFDNLQRSLRQLHSDEVPALGLSVQLASYAATVVTDDEGYFATELEFTEPLTPGWWVAQARTLDVSPLEPPATGKGNVLVPDAGARFGVISDIDDTILQSHVRNRVKQAYVSLLGNAVTRLSFPGTRDLYVGLERAGNGAPCFYVSRSAWNIHATLEHFIAHQGLPKGPLILRDVGLFNDREKRRGHKRREIERIFATYPELPFILIGDSA
ncbi:MAG TPA: phosphatase domain-containing protein, partial [Polyangiaceae bacterium]|nr:phosphatase domain-containing protein [Polyangiaceae bacterium]